MQGSLVGFTWGYKLSIEKFPFLESKISTASYMDEIAVRGNTRMKGIGYNLGAKYLETAKLQGFAEVVLRTDQRNEASMTLFRKLGFEGIKDGERFVYDPEYKDRIYLRKELI